MHNADNYRAWNKSVTEIQEAKLYIEEETSSLLLALWLFILQVPAKYEAGGSCALPALLQYSHAKHRNLYIHDTTGKKCKHKPCP